MTTSWVVTVSKLFVNLKDSKFFVQINCRKPKKKWPSYCSIRPAEPDKKGGRAASTPSEYLHRHPTAHVPYSTCGRGQFQPGTLYLCPPLPFFIALFEKNIKLPCWKWNHQKQPLKDPRRSKNMRYGTTPKEPSTRSSS